MKKSRLLSLFTIANFVATLCFIIFVLPDVVVFRFTSDLVASEFVGKWYNIIISLGKKSFIKIYSVTNKLKKIYEEEIVTKKWNEFTNDEYYISGSNINITNIRLYNTNIIEEEKSIINAISYLVNDDSKLIISDNADIFFENSYYGTQR